MNTLRQGGRDVLFTEEVQGFGNLLYLYLHAWLGRQRGGDSWVLAAPKLGTWPTVFPVLTQLTLPREELRFTDQRDTEAYQGFSSEFSAADLDAFIAVLLDNARLTLEPADPGMVTVNVRRGDYYSDPTWRAIYGFNIVDYVERAMRVASEQAPISRVRVVSDDLDWCSTNLFPMLSSYGATDSVGTGPDAVRDLSTLASSPRLVLANSTFSYWGGFLSGALHGQRAQVLAPAFHRRDTNGGRAWHLDPRWTVIEDPAGWPAG